MLVYTWTNEAILRDLILRRSFLASRLWSSTAVAKSLRNSKNLLGVFLNRNEKLDLAEAVCRQDGHWHGATLGNIGTNRFGRRRARG